MRLLSSLRGGLVKALEVFLIVAFILLTLDVLWGVFSRYVVGEQSRWTEEIANYLLMWIALLGAALVYDQKAHLGVDYLVCKLHPSARRWAAVIVELNVLAFAIILTVGGWILVTRSMGQSTPALKWNMGYLYAAAPISGAFFILFCLEHLYEIFTWRDTETPGDPAQITQ